MKGEGRRCEVWVDMTCRGRWRCDLREEVCMKIVKYVGRCGCRYGCRCGCREV